MHYQFANVLIIESERFQPRVALKTLGWGGGACDLLIQLRKRYPSVVQDCPFHGSLWYKGCSRLKVPLRS